MVAIQAEPQRMVLLYILIARQLRYTTRTAPMRFVVHKSELGPVLFIKM